jgi:hypothetical protein
MASHPKEDWKKAEQEADTQRQATSVNFRQVISEQMTSGLNPGVLLPDLAAASDSQLESRFADFP